MIAIRHAEPSDFPTLVELMRELGDPADAESLGSKLAGFDASNMDALLVAEKDGSVVAPALRRQGIGKRLLDAATTGESNDAAQENPR